MDVEAGYMAVLPATARWAIDTGPVGDRDRGMYLYDAAGDIILVFQEPSVGLTPADIGALSSLLDAQQAEIDRLKEQLGDAGSRGSRGQVDWGPLAVVDDGAEGNLDAAGGEGRVILRGPCVFLRTEDGHRTTLIWRSGQTAWDPVSHQIMFHDRDLGEIRLSHRDRIQLGGAPVGEGPATDPVWLAKPDPSCPSLLDPWVVHQVDIVDG